jgi:hypothetical protein
MAKTVELATMDAIMVGLDLEIQKELLRANGLWEGGS